MYYAHKLIEMSQDLVIIEDQNQIIEISDDESCKDVIIINDEVGEASQNQPFFWARTLRSSESSFNNFSEGNTSDPDVRENNIKQENSNDSQDIIAASSTSSFSGVIKSENIRANRRKRRLRQRKKRINASKKAKAGNKDICDENGNASSPSFLQSSWSANNRNRSSSNDFSKLNWLKPLCDLASPPHLQMVIIDRSHPYWRIENEKWLMVEQRLLEALHAEMKSSNDPSIGFFDGAKWARGIKIIGCHNQDAFDFIMNFVRSLENLWNGAKLDVFPITQLNRHVVKTYIPPPTIKTELALSLIKLQNPAMHSSDWKVIRERERICGGKDIWISVNAQSYMELSAVRGEVKFGINRIFVNPS